MAIAIVDDTPLNLTLIQALVRKLTPPGTEIVTFSSPLEGLQWCGSHEPDLVIVDYMMPDLNGIEFIETDGTRQAWFLDSRLSPSELVWLSWRLQRILDAAQPSPPSP